MKDNINDLKFEFKRIKAKGFIPSMGNGPTGIGKTFENLLGKEDDNLALPDFGNIEIKTRRYGSNSYVTLFCILPKTNNDKIEVIKYLCENFGYYDSSIESKKILMNCIYSNKFNFVGDNFIFKLSIDYCHKRIVLSILNRSFINELDNNTIYWDFEDIKSKLEAKTPYLALIYALRKKIDNKEYFNYYKLELYKLRNLEYFLQALEKGYIRIRFQIGLYRTGKKIGRLHDHGTAFEIDYNYFEELYNRINTFF